MKAKTKNILLTKTEIKLMNILWDIKQATVNELIRSLPEPKPPYTTVLTVMQVLTRKQVVTFKKQGRAYTYIPLLSYQEYLNNYMNEICGNLFQGSIKSFFLFFIKHENISRKEIEEAFELSDEQIDPKQ